MARYCGHFFGQIAIDAAGAIIGGVHARAGDRFVAIHQIFALAEGVKKHRHRPDVERVRAEPKEMIQNPRQFVEQNADIARPQRRLDAEDFFDRHHIRVLVHHHRHIIEAIHIRHGLQKGLLLGEFFGRAMQKPDVRIGAGDDFAVEFQHQAQNAVRRRVLRPEVHRVIADVGHGFIRSRAAARRRRLRVRSPRRARRAAQSRAAESKPARR